MANPRRVGEPYFGLYQKSGEFSKSGLSGNRTFSFKDAGLLSLFKIDKLKPGKIGSNLTILDPLPR